MRALKRFDIYQKFKSSIAQQKDVIEAYSKRVEESETKIHQLKKEINLLLPEYGEPPKYKI